MSVSFTIHQKGGLFKARMELPELTRLLGSVVNIGGIGAFFIFREKPQPQPGQKETAYMMYGNRGMLGRGFYLYIDASHSSYRLQCPLPTTTADLEDFFTVAGTLAKQLDAKALRKDDGEEIARAALPAIFAEVRKHNYELLQSYATTRPGFSVSGVRMPFFIPESLCQRITSVPAAGGEKYFAAYLAEKQAMDYYYLKPIFHTDDKGEPFAAYALTEGVHTVIPKTPFIPYGESPFGSREIATWLVSLVPLKIEVLGTLPYQHFLQRLDPSTLKEFDPNHYYLPGLSLRQMQAILEENQRLE